MIVVIPQLICCFVSAKTEIPHDYGAPGRPGAAASLRAAPTALPATTGHQLNGIDTDGVSRIKRSRSVTYQVAITLTLIKSWW